MKTLYCIIASLILSVSLFGQAPPVLRQALTTNTAPVNPTNPGQIPIWTGTAWQFGTNLPGLVVTGLVSGDLLWTNNAGNLQPVSNVWTVSVPRTLTISNSATLWGLSSNRLGIFGPEPFVAKRNSGQTTVLGHNALTNDAVTGDHTAIGFQSLALLTNGGFLASVGDDAMGVLLQGRQNTALGSQALFAQQFGTNVTAVGYQALASLVVSNNNTAVGSRALLNNRAEDNTGVGFNAGELLVTGRKNSFLGARATVFFDDCASNVVAGVDSFASFQSVILGNDITPGDPSTQLTLVGNSTRAGSHNNSFAIGYRARVTADNQGILGSNVTHYLFRNLLYGFPSAAATDISFLRNDGAGTLDWSTNANNIGVTNLSVYNNVIFNGSIVSNFNRDLNWTNDGVVLKGSIIGLNPKSALRWGAEGTVNNWHDTNVGFYSVAFGSNVMNVGQWASLSGGFANEIQTNARSAVLAGGATNSIRQGAMSSVIGGGSENQISTNSINSVISGGWQNSITNGRQFSFIGGGQQNLIIGGNNAVVVGGSGNRITLGTNGFIGGGINNFIGANGPSLHSTIGGGNANLLRGSFGFIGGGGGNVIGNGVNDCDGSAIAGGVGNGVGATSSDAITNGFVGGGFGNSIGNGGHNSVIAGGTFNSTTSGTNTTIGGGNGNSIGNAAHRSVIGGGSANAIANSAIFGVIPGGASNRVEGSFAWAIGDGVTNTSPSSLEIGFNHLNTTTKSTFTASNTIIRTSFATAPDTVVTLTADNQVVNATLRTHIRLASDSAVAGDRTFLLTGTNVTSGAHAILEWTGTNAGELVDDSANSGAGNIRLSATWTPTQYDTLSLIFNGTDWIETARATN